MTQHPLVQKEWKNTRWIMLIFSLMYIIFAAMLNKNIEGIKSWSLFNNISDVIFMDETYRLSWLVLPVMLIGIVVLTIVLFTHDRNHSVGKFINTLPFGRKKQFTIKYMMGLITFTLPFLLFSAVILIMRVSNEKWMSEIYKYAANGEILTKQDHLGRVFLWLGIMWLIMLAVYSFLMLVQTLMGQNIIAGVVGAITFLVPWFLALAIPVNVQILLNKYWTNGVQESVEFFFFANPKRTIEEIQLTSQSLSNKRGYYIHYTYENLGLNIAILVGIIILSLLLAYNFTQSNDVEKNGDIVMYPWVGKVLIAGVTICALLLLPIIVTVFTQIENKILTLGSMIVGAFLGYLISSKSIEMTKKHG